MLKIIEMRHGNPPNFDAEPLMKLQQIANALRIKNSGSVYNYLTRFYENEGIKRQSK